MRRRRQALQVSTFPFLAVLLCAMGALILLLLVIDRRAKIAARAKAAQAQQQLLAERARESEQRQAEIQRRRQEREEEARRQERQLAAKAKAARGEAEKTRQTLDQEESRYRDLQRQLQALRGRLSQTEQDVAAVEAETNQAGAADDASRKERHRLTEQLAQLEAVLANLKEMREREKKTFSLVPYQGKRGQGRKPIYVECQGEAVVFHPDTKELRGFEMVESSIRREVEERIARQRAGPEPPGKDEAPYLFLLVRPQGITTYYLVQNALVGLKVDFGYEFVDADWVLDFSGQGDLPAPWKRVVASSMKLVPKEAAPPVRVGTGQAAFAGGPAQQGMPGRGGGRGPKGFVFPGMDLYLMEKYGDSGGGGGIPGVGPFALAGAGPERGDVSFVGVPDSVGRGGSGSNLGGPGGSTSARPGTLGPARGTSFASPEGPSMTQEVLRPANLEMPPPGFMPTRGGSAGAAGPNGVPPPTGKLPREGFPPTGTQVPGGSPIATTNGGQVPADGMARPVALSGPAPNTAGAGPTAAPNEGQPTSGGVPRQELTPDGVVKFAPIVPGGKTQPGQGGSPPDPAGVPSPPGTYPAGPGGGGGVPGGTGDPGSDIPPTPLLSPTPLPGAARGMKTTPDPLPRRRYLNRDWVIPIECQADGVLLIPGRVRFSNTALAPTPGQVHALALTVQQLIAKRQATVAPGEPPYRPRIVFQVRPEGLRAYYLAYPLLECLRLPMARENVSAREAPSNRRTIFDP
jgi:hypothetical protein